MFHWLRDHRHAAARREIEECARAAVMAKGDTLNGVIAPITRTEAKEECEGNGKIHRGYELSVGCGLFPGRLGIRPELPLQHQLVLML